jgi:hypothetical protein
MPRYYLETVNAFGVKQRYRVFATLAAAQREQLVLRCSLGYKKATITDIATGQVW